MPTCGNRHNEVRRKKLIWGKAGKPKETKNNKKNKKNKKQKKQENQENQEDLLGQNASDIGLLFFLFFSGPKGRMQRVESFHAPREGCRELSLVICFSSCQSMHMSKQRMCKEECKKRTLTVPCSEKKTTCTYARRNNHQDTKSKTNCWEMKRYYFPVSLVFILRNITRSYLLYGFSILRWGTLKQTNSPIRTHHGYKLTNITTTIRKTCEHVGCP